MKKSIRLREKNIDERIALAIWLSLLSIVMSLLSLASWENKSGLISEEPTTCKEQADIYNLSTLN